MIETAKSFKELDNPPEFQIMDMRNIGDHFPTDSFDGAWVSASLLHIPENDVPVVLEGIRNVVKNGGKVYIGMKEGKQGPQLVVEHKYGKEVSRQFIFWTEENFKRLVEQHGFRVISTAKSESGMTGDYPTSWMDFQLEVVK